jgi:hypothetical protein
VRCYLEKTHQNKGLVEWLKVKALSPNPSTAKKKLKKLNTKRTSNPVNKCIDELNRHFSNNEV